MKPASRAFGALVRLDDIDKMVDPLDFDIRSCRVRDASGNLIGRVEGLFLDPIDFHIQFLEVTSGTFLGRGKLRVLFPIGLIASVEAGEVRLSDINRAGDEELVYHPAIIDDYRI